MADLNLSTLTEADIITKRVMPAILDAGWSDTTQIRQEVKLRDGKVIVRGKVAARRTVKSADIVLYYKPGIPLAVDIARRIKKEIRRELHLTASAGVSYNKFLAKIASDYRKPDGLFTIHPSRAEKFIAALPIEAFWGVGHATAERMRALSITNGAQLRARDKDFLVRHFGKTGAIFYNFARGVDDRPVEPSRMRKSVGCEETYRENVTRAEALEQRLPLLAEELAGRLARSGFRGNTLTLKVKFPDFVQKTRCATVPEILTEKEGILPLARTLMEELDSGDRTFRLLGLSVSHPQEEQRQGIWEQLWLELEY